MFASRKAATIASNLDRRSPSHRRTAFIASDNSRLSTRSARQSEHCLNSARYSALQIGQYRILAFLLSADSSTGKLTRIVWARFGRSVKGYACSRARSDTKFKRHVPDYGLTNDGCASLNENEDDARHIRHTDRD